MIEKTKMYRLGLVERRKVRLLYPWAIIPFGLFVFVLSWWNNENWLDWTLSTLFFLYIEICALLFETMSSKSLINRLILKGNPTVESNGPINGMIYLFHQHKIFKTRKNLRWIVLTALLGGLLVFGWILTIMVFKSSNIYLWFVLLSILPLMVYVEEVYKYRPYKNINIVFFFVYPLVLFSLLVAQYVILDSSLSGFFGYVLTSSVFVIVEIGVVVRARMRIDDIATHSTINNVWKSVIGSFREKEKGLEYSIPEIIHNNLRYEFVTILMASGKQVDQEENLVIASVYPNNEKALGKRVKLKSITGEAFAKSKAVIWNDVQRCNYYEHLDGISAENVHSEMAIPIIHKGRTIGVIDVQSSSLGVFGNTDKEMIESLSGVLGSYYYSKNLDDVMESFSEKNKNPINVDLALLKDDYEVVDYFIGHLLDAGLIKDVGYRELTPFGFPLKAKYNSDSILGDKELIEIVADWRPFTMKMENGVRKVLICFGDNFVKLGVLKFTLMEKINNEGVEHWMLQTLADSMGFALFGRRSREILDRTFGNQPNLHRIKNDTVGKDGMTSGNDHVYRKFYDKVCELLEEENIRSETTDSLNSQVNRLLTSKGIPKIKIDFDKYYLENRWLTKICYLIFNELVNNAVKHGQGDRNEIGCSISVENNTKSHSYIKIIVSNLGTLINKNGTGENKKTGGEYLIEAVENKLAGERTFIEDPEKNLVSVCVKFPVVKK